MIYNIDFFWKRLLILKNSSFRYFPIMYFLLHSTRYVELIIKTNLFQGYCYVSFRLYMYGKKKLKLQFFLLNYVATKSSSPINKCYHAPNCGGIWTLLQESNILIFFGRRLGLFEKTMLTSQSQ